MEINFCIVPDYVCSGVVEHYFKTSFFVKNDNGVPVGVFSVIINKKTQAIQRQAKVDNLNARRVRTSLYGYGNGVVIKDYQKLAAEFANFNVDERTWLRICCNQIRYALSIGFSKPTCAIVQADRILLQDFADNFRKQVLGIASNTFTTTPQVAESESISAPIEDEKEDAPIENVAENATVFNEPAEPPRKSRRVARLVFANGLTEFLNGNLYEIDESKNVQTSNRTYVCVKTENGEERYLDERRVKIEEQFTEPPKTDTQDTQYANADVQDEPVFP